jgi:ABC-type multidrug transport system fused ATPase/permease subunit
LSGSLRQNLDPFGQHNDIILNEALRAAGLFALQEHDTEEVAARLTLDSTIASVGGNLSVGQRQILALACGVRASC